MDFGYTGARKVAIGEKNGDLDLQNLYNRIISARVYLSILSLILLIITSILFSVSTKVFISMLLLFIIVIATTIQLTWLFQGKQDMKFITLVNVISRIISLILIFVLVKKPEDLYIYCFLYSFTNLLSSIISQRIAYKKYKLSFKLVGFKAVKKEIYEAKELFISAVMTKVFSGIGITILGIMGSSGMVGIYSAIYKIPYVMTMFFSPISQALYPHNSQKYNGNLINYIKKIRSSVPIVFLLFGIPCIIIFVFRKSVVNTLFGNEYAQYCDLVIPLILQFLFAILNNFLGIQTLVATGHQKKYSKAFIISSIFTILLNYILCKKFTLYGVAYASLIDEVLLSILLINEIISIVRKEKRIEKNKSNDYLWN